MSPSREARCFGIRDPDVQSTMARLTMASMTWRYPLLPPDLFGNVALVREWRRIGHDGEIRLCKRLTNRKRRIG